MKILFLSAWCPLPADNGARLRILNLLRGLARSHDVHLLAFAPTDPGDEALRELRTFCAHVELVAEEPFANRPVGRLVGLLSAAPRSLLANHSPAMAAAVALRAGRGYDAVIAHDVHMMPYALLLPGVPRIVDEVPLPLFHDRLRNQPNPARRARDYLTWWKLVRYLRRALGEFVGATGASVAEAELIRAVAPPRTSVAVVPNGVDLAAYTHDYGSPLADTLIYPGSLTFAPNLEAVRFFAAEILPRLREVRPGVRLLVTGRAEPAQIAALPPCPGLELVGHLPDVRPAIARAWAEVVPLRSGSGTRLKILEALALGTPVISTTKGAEGLNLDNGRDILIVDDPGAFAAQVLRVLSSGELRGRLSAAGRAAVAAYDWSASIAAIDDLLARTCATA